MRRLRIIIRNLFLKRRYYNVSYAYQGGSGISEVDCLDRLPTREAYEEEYDLLIAHPPCTHLAVSGARWFKEKQKEQIYALRFVQLLLDAPIAKIALENPISIISSKIRKPNQIIQPWQFGHGETKATCLWLKGLPKLVPTKIVQGRTPRVYHASPGPDRWKERSRTLQGIADAMAEQWGGDAA